jgi:AraC-like DNA-binding protein
MIRATYIPKPPLSAFVALFWLYEGHAPRHAKERRLPTGTVELVVNLREDTLRVYDRQDTNRCQSFRGSLISGVHSEFFVIDTAEQTSIMGVAFKPGGAFPFLGLPASEVQNTHVSLDALWGARADDLRCQLLEASAPEARLRAFERCLMAQAARPLERHPAVDFALKAFQDAPPTPRISDVIEQIGLSAKRFVQVFTEEVGLTPKLFCRIRRFQEVLHLIRRRQQVGWADVAATCGYFDQAHFIRDFRAFSGFNPSVYHARRGEHPNHVPLHD